MNLVDRVAIIGIMLSILGMLAAIWLTWRHHLSLLFMARKEIKAEARILLDRYGDRAQAFISTLR